MLSLNNDAWGSSRVQSFSMSPETSRHFFFIFSEHILSSSPPIISGCKKELNIYEAINLSETVIKGAWCQFYSRKVLNHWMDREMLYCHIITAQSQSMASSCWSNRVTVVLMSESRAQANMPNSEEHTFKWSKQHGLLFVQPTNLQVSIQQQEEDIYRSFYTRGKDFPSYSVTLWEMYLESRLDLEFVFKPSMMSQWERWVYSHTDSSERMHLEGQQCSKQHANILETRGKRVRWYWTLLLHVVQRLITNISIHIYSENTNILLILNGCTFK